MRVTLFLKPLLMLSTVFLLSSCIPAALVAGATAGGAILYDKRGFVTMNQDQNARVYAQRALDNDDLLKDHAHVSVAVFNHIALLVGQVQTQDLRQQAEQRITRIPNIQRVYNEITVGNPLSALQRTNDTWITTKVRTMMLSKPGLRSTNLKIITENGVVYLMGNVSRKQATIAADVARRVRGVTKVVKVFEYE
ncbi:MAG: phospholipid-binding protein [Coxiella sp. RIFCSPHIGHO2_12_FULL_44_14]|nr:MAG: phospholipid-binding protein [Coxiella sp. RIFCSPHIGHO2_12_FULL_44_14]